MKVFISYSLTDQLLADTVAKSLQDAGLEVFYLEQVPPGKDAPRQRPHQVHPAYSNRLHNLNESDAMVVLVTPSALASEAVREDIDYALGEKRFKGRLIPVLVGDPTELPADRVPWIFKRLKTVTLPKDSENEEQLEQIARVLKDAA